MNPETEWRFKTNTEKVESWIESALESVARTREEALSFLVHKLIDGETIDSVLIQAGIAIHTRKGNAIKH